MALSDAAATRPLPKGFGDLHLGEAVKAYAANALILAGFPILFGFFLLPMLAAHENLPNVIWPSSAIILLSLLFLGVRAFTITAIDYLLAAWFTLAVLSHVYATAMLARALPPEALYMNLGFVVSMGLSFRAVLCMILINPPFATRVFVATVIGELSGAAILGLMQRYGPDSAWAVKIATQFAPRKEKVMEGFEGGRPTSIFGGPNLLGYADTVLACFGLGWGLTKIRHIQPWKVMLVMGLLGFATFSSVSSQSRSTVLIMAVFPLIFGIQLRRRAQNQFNTALFSALLAIGCMGMIYVLQTGRFDYLYSVRHTGIKHDISYEVRVQALSQLGQIAPEIAPLGSGMSQSNNPHPEYLLGYDRYSTIGVDNDWANAFEGYGVWGPLWLMLLFGLWLTSLLRLRGDPRPDANLVLYVGGSLMLSVLVLSPTAVRVMKYETAGYTFLVLGAISAWTLLPRPRPSVKAL